MSKHTFKILIVDDEINILRSLSVFLTNRGYEIYTAINAEEALKRLSENLCDLVLLDYKMPGIDGLTLIKRIKEKYPNLYLIMMTAFGTIPSAVEAMRAGTYDYLTKPFEKNELLLRIHQIEKVIRDRDEISYLKNMLNVKYDFRSIIGNSPVMKKVFVMMQRAAEAEEPVLITGETGTGKELVARAIHFNSRRKSKKFVEVHCAAIPESLLESELFGHTKGAFTGATDNRIGKFEAAEGGSFFLDEVSSITLTAQVKLLRVLQEKKIEPIGSNKVREVNIRILSSSNEDLEKRIEAGFFREDLFYRLNVIHIHLPPLRERKEDIPLLVQQIIEQHEKRNYKISQAAMDLLLTGHWRGNVRELENVVKSALVNSESGMIEPQHLPYSLQQIQVLEKSSAPGSLKDRVMVFEKIVISGKLIENHGDVTKTAREFKTPVRTLQRKIKIYKIRNEKIVLSKKSAKK